MRLAKVVIHVLDMPLVAPFRTSFGTETARRVPLLEVHGTVDGGDVVGWGECVAMTDPLYSSEYVAGAIAVLRDYLVPLLRSHGEVTAEAVGGVLAGIRGHRMAKGALEMAVLDAELRSAGTPFGRYLGVTRAAVPSGVSVGIQPSVAETVAVVGRYLDEGYARIKLKIEPGWDLEPVAAVRAEFGDDVLLQVDANSAYTLADAEHLARLDRFGLLLIEQPLGDEDLRCHAELAKLIHTPVCLDESIVSLDAARDAIALGAAAIINIKPGRVGGYLAARAMHDLCVEHGVPVWCGGMLETGLGRGANAALAALPGFTLPGDISASNRFYDTDITVPAEMHAGEVAVPTTAGIGPEPVPELVERFRVDRLELS